MEKQNQDARRADKFYENLPETIDHITRGAPIQRQHFADVSVLGARLLAAVAANRFRQRGWNKERTLDHLSGLLAEGSRPEFADTVTDVIDEVFVFDGAPFRPGDILPIPAGDGSTWRCERVLTANSRRETFVVRACQFNRATGATLSHFEVIRFTWEQNPSKDVASRFQKQFLCLHSLNSARVVQAIACGDADDGRLYIRYKDHGVASIRTSRPTTLRGFLEDTSNILDGLAAMHTARDDSWRGHGDLQPDNIVRGEDGNLTLIDPSLAAGDAAPAFAAPERLALTYALDPRSDIYSLGAVLYWCVTGIAPSTDYARHKAETDQPDPWSEFLGRRLGMRRTVKLPDRVIAIVVRCLSHDRADRFGSASEVTAALRVWRLRRKRRRVSLSLCATLALAVIGLFGVNRFESLYEIHIEPHRSLNKAESLVMPVRSMTTSLDDASVLVASARSILEQRELTVGIGRKERLALARASLIDAKIEYHRGHGTVAEGHLRAGIVRCDNQLRIEPDDSEATGLLVDFLCLYGELLIQTSIEDAGEIENRLVECLDREDLRFDQAIRVRTVLAKIDRSREAYDLAIERLTRIESDISKSRLAERDPDFKRRLGLTLLLRGTYRNTVINEKATDNPSDILQLAKQDLHAARDILEGQRHEYDGIRPERNLSRVYNELAEALIRENGSDEALGYSEKARGIASALTAADPSNLTFARDAVVTGTLRAEMLEHNGDKEAARRAFAHLADLSRAWVDRDPKNEYFWDNVIFGYQEAHSIALSTNDNDAALRHGGDLLREASRAANLEILAPNEVAVWYLTIDPIQLRDREEAIRLVLLALERNPGIIEEDENVPIMIEMLDIEQVTDSLRGSVSSDH